MNFSESFKAFVKRNSFDSRSSKEKFSCPYCPRKLNFRSAFVRHMRTHSNEKNFVCSMCHAGFKQDYQLKYHIKNMCQL